MRQPNSVPDGYTQPINLNQRNWLLLIISLIFSVAAVAVVTFVSSGIFARLATDPVIILDFNISRTIYLITLLIIIFFVTFEIHEQLHYLTAKVLDLQPIYRRLNGYVIIQETWVSRRDLNLMTAAPILIIQLPTLLMLTATSGALGDIIELIFIMNAGFIAKDFSDILIHFHLPEEAQFWMSDLGENPVEYFSIKETAYDD